VQVNLVEAATQEHKFPCTLSVCASIFVLLWVYLSDEETIFSKKSLYWESLSRRHITYLERWALAPGLSCNL